MSGLDKKNRTITDLPGIIEVHAIEVSVHRRMPRTSEHCAAISAAKKKYYASEAGILERKARSERTKKYWASPAGQAKKERLRQKLTKS